jgi:superoxide dismutase, Cu-Zn family
MLLALAAILTLPVLAVSQNPDARNAVALANAWQLGAGGTSQPISGTVTVSQVYGSEEVTVTVEMTGFPPQTSHGFHIHAIASLSNGCLAAGSHFNPYGVAHGSRAAPLTSRHVGDLGNVVSDATGSISASFVDSVISLGVGSAADTAARSVVGRTVVLHAFADDLGLGPNPPAGTSNTTGNAGARMACALLVLQTPPGGSGGGTVPPPVTSGAIAATAVLGALFLVSAAAVLYACCCRAPSAAPAFPPGAAPSGEFSMGDAYATVSTAAVGAEGVPAADSDKLGLLAKRT